MAGSLAVLAGAGPAAGQEVADLDPRIPGDYRAATGDLVVIARTATRPVWFEPATGRVRVLFREDDSTFRAGPGLLARDSVAFRVRFRSGGRGGFGRLVRERAGEPPLTASRVAPYGESEVSFRSGDVELAGTLFLPSGEGPRPGVVLVHGSGAQDRYGPFGYYRILADLFARRGFAVLAFDKRGVGGSGGDWRTAGFDELASDVAAAIRRLEARPEVRAGSVGLWGISQAGWVAAEATRLTPRPAFVVLASAAGAAIGPAEQNAYNVRAELRARGFAEASVGRAVEAWRRLHALVAARREAARPTAEARALARLVGDLREEGLPAGLLPPPPSEVAWEAADQWFLALDVGFDPLPVWADWPGPLLAVFGGRDASTPTGLVVERLSALEGGEGPDAEGTGPVEGRVVEVEIFPEANHFLLESESGAIEELPRLRRFVPGALERMVEWAAGQAEPAPSSSRRTSRNASP